MADREIINVGTYPGDGTGDSPRVAWAKANNNHLELFNRSAMLANTGLPTPANSRFWRQALGLYERINVKAYPYLATGDGFTNDGPAIQAAIDAGGQGSCVYLPEGTYYSEQELILRNHIQVLEGDGQRVSIIKFQDTVSGGSAIRIKRDAAGESIFQVQVKNLGVQFGFGAIQYAAIEAVDVRSCVIQGIQVLPGDGSSGTNIGLWWKGRDNNIIDDIYGQTDVPIRLSKNPNSYIDCDQTNFTNLALTCQQATGDCIHIDEGIYTSQLKFEGSQSWNKGKNGLYRRDLNAVYRSDGLYIGNVRREQCEDPNGETVHIEMGQLLNGGEGNVLNNFVMDGTTFLDGFQNGVFLRGVNGATFTNVTFTQTTGQVALDADNSCDRIYLSNCFIQQGSSCIMTGLTNVLAFPQASGGIPMSETCLWLRDPNQPMTLTGTRINGGLGLGTTPPTSGIAAYKFDDSTDPTSPIQFIRAWDTKAGVPRIISIPFIERELGSDEYAAALEADRFASLGNWFTSLNFLVNATDAPAASTADLMRLLRLDGRIQSVICRVDDTTTDPVYPLTVTRHVSAVSASPRIVGLVLSEQQVSSEIDVRVPLATVESERTSTGYRSKLGFRINADDSSHPIPVDQRLVMQLDSSSTANDTSMLLWDVTAGSLVRVSRGSADSGGTGFRLLRVPN